MHMGSCAESLSRSIDQHLIRISWLRNERIARLIEAVTRRRWRRLEMGLFPILYNEL
jgi:hypothetical protein